MVMILLGNQQSLQHLSFILDQKTFNPKEDLKNINVQTCSLKSN